MLLQQIVEKLDAELDRLQRLREIVAGLKSAPIALDPFEDVRRAAEPVPAAESVQVQRIPARLPRRGGTRARRTAVDKLGNALTSAIPVRPVVVTADALARESAARKQTRVHEPKAAEGTLGAMIRALGRQGAV